VEAAVLGCALVGDSDLIPMTLLEVLRASTSYLEKREIESPRLNAEHLLSHVLGRRRLELYLGFENIVSEAELIPLRELIRRRGQGEPLQHLLGTVEFCGHTFLSDKRALVPRPETEELVELILQSTINHQPSTILDVGTGSGVIALSLAAHFPEGTVYGVDVSIEALDLARENAQRLGLSDRVRFGHGNLLETLSERFDLIVANLPYVAMKDRSTLSREVLHDPEVALFAGEGGDELIRQLIEQAPVRLQSGGLLALEVGTGQAEGLCQLLRQKNYNDIQSKNDYSGIPRFLFARYG
jgi:release factor glutamine methyltransferase